MQLGCMLQIGGMKMVTNKKKLKENKKCKLPYLRICPKCKTAWLFGERENGVKTDRFKINCNCNYAYKNSEWCVGRTNAIKNWNKKMRFRLFTLIRNKFKK